MFILVFGIFIVLGCVCNIFGVVVKNCEYVLVILNEL